MCVFSTKNYWRKRVKHPVFTLFPLNKTTWISNVKSPVVSWDVLVRTVKKRIGNCRKTQPDTMQMIGHIVKCFVAVREKGVTYDHNVRSVSLLHLFFFSCYWVSIVNIAMHINRIVNARSNCETTEYSLTPRRIKWLNPEHNASLAFAKQNTRCEYSIGKRGEDDEETEYHECGKCV